MKTQFFGFSASTVLALTLLSLPQTVSAAPQVQKTPHLVLPEDCHCPPLSDPLSLEESQSETKLCKGALQANSDSEKKPDSPNSRADDTTEFSNQEAPQSNFEPICSCD